MIDIYFDMACVMQIQQSIAKIRPFHVDPDGKLVPEKDIKHVKR